MKILPGNPYPLGADYDGAGTNFSIFSEVAERVELCLFDKSGDHVCVDLPEVSGYCWHGYFPGIKPGQRYGFRVHGEWNPAKGHRCNPAKLLLDPYAKSIKGNVKWSEAVFPYSFKKGSDTHNNSNSARFVPHCVVHSDTFDWEDDQPLKRPWHETILYETHVKGFTINHPDIPQKLRGTYAGLAHPAAIKHLTELGISAVELMPVHQFIHDRSLVERGLSNYWGYNSIGFFAPHNEYAASHSPHGTVVEFKEMVKTLHRAGIEVILDVAYNHTAEGNELGPMLSFKGIDNHAYYRFKDGDPGHYMDFTGTGNSLNMRHPHVLQLIMDSLRYWITEMHVDGFRFDLAAALAREFHEVDRLAAFFDLVQQDPLVSQVKLIAEPWDVGEGGYQLGNFPPVWSEWNGKYRDCLRDFWNGRDIPFGEFANRFTGSPDLYKNTGRMPFASINFATCHDGFTLQDLVSYDHKHNEANGEDNRDGSNDNRSYNCGIEGPADDPAILALRARQKRNFLATVMLSQGVPMLLGGDEIGRSQQGNNNAYCQDNEISWYDWKQTDESLLQFCRKLITFRREHPAFHQRRWFHEHKAGSEGIGWFTQNGEQMNEENQGAGAVKTLGIFLNGAVIPNPNPKGEAVTDDSFYVIFNAHHEDLTFTLPDQRWSRRWIKVLDTSVGWLGKQDFIQGGATIQTQAHSLILLQSAARET